MPDAEGKQRESRSGRDGLLWSDVYEPLGLAGQTCPLAISPQNAVVFSPSAHRSSSIRSSHLLPKVSLLCYPIDNVAGPAESGSRKTFALPLPSFPLPHLPATFVSFSPASDHFLAFFPLAPAPSGAASCSTWNWTQPAAGEGGTLALWALTGTKGRAPTDWKLQESWACPQGEEVIDVAWLGAQRLWMATSAEDVPSNGPGSSRPTFSRRARCGPALLPSQHPTFIALSAAHAVTLYHPPTSSPNNNAATVGAQQQVILRTTRCTVDGPGSTTWGLMSDSNSGDEAKRRRRRIRRARFYLRENDDSIYLALHSTVLPPLPPAASSGSAAVTRNGSVVQNSGATGTAEILAGLGIDVDIPTMAGSTPLPDPGGAEMALDAASTADSHASREDEEVSQGDETFIEVVEITADFFVGEHTTLSTHPYPSIPLASSPELSASAVLSHLAFYEVTPSEPAQSGDGRAIGLVAVVVDLAPGINGQPGRPASELHQWRIDKTPSELSKAFAELEAASVPTLDTARGLGNETAMFVQSRVLPSSVLMALGPVQGSASSVIAMEIEHESWSAGRIGAFRVIDLATLQDAAGLESAPLKVDRALGHQVPTCFAATPNAAFVARLGDRSSTIDFHLHPAFVAAAGAEGDPDVARRLGQAMALALHRGADVQDLIRVMPLRRALSIGGGTKRKCPDDIADVEAVLYACWDALDSGGPSQSTSIGRSHWILLLVRLQHDLYRSVGSDRQHVAKEILTLARHNSAFERCCSRPRTGRKPQYQLDAAFRLIRETERALGTIERLLLSAVVESSWSSWGAAPEDGCRQLPVDYIVCQPTTRALLSSLAAHLDAFAAFLSTSQAPLTPPPGTLGLVLGNGGDGGGGGPSHAVGDLARAMLADLRQVAALGDASRFGEALKQMGERGGVLNAKDAPAELANESLLRLEIPSEPTAMAEAGEPAAPPPSSQAFLASLPLEAFDQAALFRSMA